MTELFFARGRKSPSVLLNRKATPATKNTEKAKINQWHTFDAIPTLTMELDVGMTKVVYFNAATASVTVTAEARENARDAARNAAMYRLCFI